MKKYNFQYPITFREFWTTISLKDKLFWLVMMAFPILILPFILLSFAITPYELPPDDQMIMLSIAILFALLLYPIPSRFFGGDGKRMWLLDVLGVYTVVVGFFIRPIYHVFIVLPLYMPIGFWLSVRWILLTKLRGKLDDFEKKWNLK